MKQMSPLLFIACLCIGPLGWMYLIFRQDMYNQAGQEGRMVKFYYEKWLNK